MILRCKAEAEKQEEERRWNILLYTTLCQINEVVVYLFCLMSCHNLSEKKRKNKTYRGKLSRCVNIKDDYFCF